MANRFIKGIKALWRGHLTVLKYAFEKKVTLEYPEQKRDAADNFRGKIEHLRDENGKLLCIGCGICQRVCPCKDLIKIEKQKNQNGEISLIYERDDSRCIFCGNCVENCPSHALKFTKEYELASSDKNSFRKVYQ